MKRPQFPYMKSEHLLSNWELNILTNQQFIRFWAKVKSEIFVLFYSIISLLTFMVIWTLTTFFTFAHTLFNARIAHCVVNFYASFCFSSLTSFTPFFFLHKSLFCTNIFLLISSVRSTFSIWISSKLRFCVSICRFYRYMCVMCMCMCFTYIGIWQW